MKPSDVLNHFQTGAALARVCGVSRQAVHSWKSIPAEHCIAIEAATNGRLTRYALRPDVFGQQVDNNNAGSRDFAHTHEVKRGKERRGNSGNG